MMNANDNNAPIEFLRGDKSIFGTLRGETLLMDRRIPARATLDEAIEIFNQHPDNVQYGVTVRRKVVAR